MFDFVCDIDNCEEPASGHLDLLDLYVCEKHLDRQRWIQAMIFLEGGTDAGESGSADKESPQGARPARDDE